jgi:hypothetical protein
MKVPSTALTLLSALVVSSCLCPAALAQEADTLPARPMYAHPRPKLRADLRPAASALPTWNGSYVYQSHTYAYNMVGTAPSTGTSTTVPTFVVPVRLSYNTSSGTVTFGALHVLSNGQTVTQNTIHSPIFQKGINFVQGGVDLGNTQYIDAFQRGNFWSKVTKATGYHLLLGQPTVLPTLSLVVPASAGKIGTEFGVRVGLADINWFDGQIQNYMASHSQIAPNSLPIFVTYDVFLTQGGCCIGGYHSAFGSLSSPQAYAHFTYIGTTGKFAQDVSALSHEVGEWADDPLVVNVNGNQTPCGALEVGDPEESEPEAGVFPYTLNGFTYHLQDLVWLRYFGAPATTSANDSFTFQQNPFSLTVCSNGS